MRFTDRLTDIGLLALCPVARGRLVDRCGGNGQRSPQCVTEFLTVSPTPDPALEISIASLVNRIQNKPRRQETVRVQSQDPAMTETITVIGINKVPYT
ncbi:hypothetical protein RRG08_020098 [Elysia crispata]|uniref:Uncharacterized protein n=1 Tax=Elysia crispata TaxID=231223 RepID=A0AAE1DSJ2_9GAST|nr:hypothetical protein RRG08_020098 [Elysia crispata]